MDGKTYEIRGDFRRLAMPESFLKCQKDGGRIRTITLKGGRFMRICYLDGKSFPSEVKEKKQGK